MPDAIDTLAAERDALIRGMRREGTWKPMFGALLSEVSEALRVASTLRAHAESEPFTKSAQSGRNYLHPGFAASDREIRRAALLLARVFAMAKTQPVEEGEPDGEPEDPFAALEALERGEGVRRSTRSRRNEQKE